MRVVIIQLEREQNLKEKKMCSTGQQVVEEILDAQRPACPPEYININIPENHPYRKNTGHTEMPVLRTRYNQQTGHSPNNPRQQVQQGSFWK